MKRAMLCERRGYVLLVVMWSLVAMAATAAVVLLVAREAIATSSNRIALEKAHWRLQGCVDHALGHLESALRDPATSTAVWVSLDSAIVPIESCSVSLRPAGMALDVNRASEPDLVRFAVMAGVATAKAESLAAFISDWKDPDDSTRSTGAEAAWYRAAERVEPRNGQLASSIEVLRVRGAEWLAGIDTLVSVDSNPMLLTRAPPAVLAGNPWLDAQMIFAIVEARQRRAFPDLVSLASALPEPTRTRMFAVLPSLLGTTTTVPLAWLLDARLLGAEVPVAANLRLARDGSRLAIIDRQSWP